MESEKVIEISLNDVCNRTAFQKKAKEYNRFFNEAETSSNRVPSAFKISNKNTNNSHCGLPYRNNKATEMRRIDRRLRSSVYNLADITEPTELALLEGKIFALPQIDHKATADEYHPKLLEMIEFNNQIILPQLNNILSLKKKCNNNDEDNLRCALQKIRNKIEYQAAFIRPLSEPILENIEETDIDNEKTMRDLHLKYYTLVDCSTQLGFWSTKENKPIANEPQIFEASFDDMKNANYTFPKSSFQYLPAAHFNDKLASAQAKKVNMIPPDVLHIVQQEIKKQLGLEISTLTKEDIRRMLKKTGLVRFYDYDISILKVLTQKQPVSISAESEAKIKYLYQCYNDAWPRLRGHRKNRLNFAYTSRQLAFLVGEDDFARSFNLLRSKEKLVASDELWKKVCDELHWPFTPCN